MKFKIEKGTETYVKLMDLKKQMEAARKAKHRLLHELGAVRYVPARGYLEGGMDAVEFDAQREGWVRIGGRNSKLYYPNSKNTELRERLKALPKVAHAALNTIVGFKPVDEIDEESLVWRRYNCPGVQFLRDAVLLDTGKAKYTPPNGDIVEILESEYNRLAEAGRKKSKVA